MMKKWKQKLLAVVTMALLVAFCLPMTALATNTGTGDDKPEHPGIEKKVDGADSTSVNAGETVEFTLTSSVPADLWKCFDFGGNATIQPRSAKNLGKPIDGAKYDLTFHDKMNSALTMNGTPTVMIGNTELEKDTHYTYTTNTTDGCTFHVTLNLVQLYVDGVITDADYANQTAITVTYTATLSADAKAGAYENKAKVSWSRKIVDRPNPDDPVNPGDEPEDPDDPVDPEDPPESEEDEVDVYTYKIQLTKTDKDPDEAGNTVLLAKAEFKLEKQTIVEENGEKKETWVVVGTDVTDEDGLVAWGGLEAGTYRLTETAAPSGYVKDSTPVIVEIPTDADEKNVVDVSFTNGQVPSTGGSGTVLYTVAGLVILGGAAAVFVVSRKRSRK